MNDQRNSDNHVAVSEWEDDGGARGSDAGRLIGNAPAVATGVARSMNDLLRPTSPTHVGSTGMRTFIKPERKRNPGRSGTTSNSACKAAASVASLGRGR